MLCFGGLDHNFCMTIPTTDSADGAPDRYYAFIKIKIPPLQAADLPDAQSKFHLQKHPDFTGGWF